MDQAVIIFGAGASYGATRTGLALPDQLGLLKRFMSMGTDSADLSMARSIVVDYVREMYRGPLDQHQTPLEEIIGPLEWLDSRKSEFHLGKGRVSNSRTLAAFDSLLCATLNRPVLRGQRVPVHSVNRSDAENARYNAFYEVNRNSENAYSVLSSKLGDLGWPVSLISFNYDLLLDRVLLHHSSKLKVDYHIPHPTFDDYFTSQRTKSVSLIKPHGSINWLWCTRCHRLTVTATKMVYSGSPCGDCTTRSPGTKWPDGTVRTLILRPSFLKSREVAAKIWDRLLEEGHSRLSRAPVWIFIGYSFPMADYWVRAWLRQASDMPMRNPKRVIVVDPASEGPTRFGSFFGKDLVEHQRKSFFDFAKGLSDQDVRA